MKAFIHNRPDFKNLIEALSFELKTDRLLIEKEYAPPVWGRAADISAMQ